jgi:hippurate hydrolase
VPPDLSARVEAAYPDALDYYKDVHQHPELSGCEVNTARKFATHMRSLGLEVTENVGTGAAAHGVVAILRNGAGPTILYRAELDALPIKEDTGLPYESHETGTTYLDHQQVPVAHSCGHDLHQAIALGTARILSDLKDSWHGNIVFVGQPAEEIGMGSRGMIEGGLLSHFPKVDHCVTVHDTNTVPVGSVGLCPGYAYANCDTIDVTIHGVGGHGAMPNLSKDPIVLGAATVMSLQSIVSRELEPGKFGVVTVGMFQGGTQANIIPDKVDMQLSVRSYDPAVRQQLRDAVTRVVTNQARVAGIPEDKLPTIDIHPVADAVYNDPAMVDELHDSFAHLLGPDNVLKLAPIGPSDDFSTYRLATSAPSTMFMLGAVDRDTWTSAQKTGQPVIGPHSPRFAPVMGPTSDTNSLKMGLTVMTTALLELTKPSVTK